MPSAEAKEALRESGGILVSSTTATTHRTVGA